MGILGTVEDHEILAYIPTLHDIGEYVAAYGLGLAACGEDFISFAAFCQAHPEGNWARMLQVIVGESEPQPSPAHERCARCHRWVYKVTSESGTNTGWLHQHTDTADGLNRSTCGYSGELGSVGWPASAVMTAADVWATVANLVTAGAPAPLSLRIAPEHRQSPGVARQMTITCQQDNPEDVIAWAQLLGITKGGRAARHDDSGGSYYTNSPGLSLMYPHDQGLAIMPGWEIHVRCDISDTAMATWAGPR